MTLRLLAQTNDKNSVAIHSHSGKAILTITDEFGQTADVVMDLAKWVAFCRDSLTRAREQYTDIPE
jgi:hypothetical protein